MKRMTTPRTFLAGGLLGLIFCTPAAALIVDYDGSAIPTVPSDSLNTASPERMSSDGNVLTLTAINNQSVWFGQSNYAARPAGLTFDAGTYLRLTMRLQDAASSDWAVLLYDNAGYYSHLTFNPAGGYNDAVYPVNQGFKYLLDGSPSYYAADLTQDFHVFEMLMVNGRVSYRFDGFYLGSSAAISTASLNILGVGDTSGSTPTGEGKMLVDAFYLDTATALTQADWDGSAQGSVPEPGSLALLAAGAFLLPMRGRQWRA
jgi:hypothetical protein